MKNKKQKRSYYNHSLISLFVFISPIVLLLLSSSYSVSNSLHNTAWAIPNDHSWDINSKDHPAVTVESDEKTLGKSF